MHARSIFPLLVFVALTTQDASAQGRAASTTPNRDGLTLQAGAWAQGGNYFGRAWFRGEVGIPIRRLDRSNLYVIVPLMFTHQSYYTGLGRDDVSWTGFSVQGGVRGEWTMLNRKGDFGLFLEGTAGPVLLNWSWDYRNSGGNRYSDTWFHVMFRAGAGVYYTAPFGLIVTAQVAGFGFGIGGGNVCDPSGACRGGTHQGGFYDGALMIGYRWE